MKKLGIKNGAQCLVVLEGLHREQGKVHAARDVALKDGDAHVLAPHWQALALDFLEVAPAHDGSPRPPWRQPILFVEDDNSRKPSA